MNPQAHLRRKYRTPAPQRQQNRGATMGLDRLNVNPALRGIEHERGKLITSGKVTRASAHVAARDA